MTSATKNSDSLPFASSTGPSHPNPRVSAPDQSDVLPAGPANQSETGGQIPSNAPLDIPITPVSVVSVTAQNQVPQVPLPQKLPNSGGILPDDPVTPPKNSKFPAIVILLFIVVAIAGFGGSFVLYMMSGKPVKKQASVPLPPPQPAITVAPTETAVNPFITPTVSFKNLFTSVVQAYDNPFEDSNPFSGATSNNTDKQPYQNPFEGLK